MVHVLPAAGSASRIGGIPKSLLPIGQKSKSLLGIHIELALEADLEVVVVTAPILHEVVNQIILNQGYPKVTLLSYQSKSMSDSLVHASEQVDSEKIISVSMPDTYMPQFKVTDLINMRKCAPSVSVIKATDEQYSRLGQVAINQQGYVTNILDKSINRISEYVWTGFAINSKCLNSFSRTEATPGIELARMADQSEELSAIRVLGQYFDCGTIHEYKNALEYSLLTQ
jgi:choline kinase